MLTYVIIFKEFQYDNFFKILLQISYFNND